MQAVQVIRADQPLRVGGVAVVVGDVELLYARVAETSAQKQLDVVRPAALRDLRVEAAEEAGLQLAAPSEVLGGRRWFARCA